MESWVAKLVDPKDVTDAYVDVELGKAKIAKTSVINNDLNPVWNETFRYLDCYYFIYHEKWLCFDRDNIYWLFMCLDENHTN